MSENKCVLCRSATDDEVQLGEKYTSNGVTAHYYCLLLTSALVQRGDDDDGISGFLPNDIKAEVTRSSKLFCAYCKEKNATIGCCIRSCRKSFHLPCALANNCRFEFVDPFKSFCDSHHGIEKPDKVHKFTDLCTICYDEMGEYNRMNSIQSPCCNKDSWYHKLCLMKYARTSGYFLKCPLCNDSDQFRQSIAKHGVFIPDRDAEWEETGPNQFYDFQQHTERPHQCIAKTCKCQRGRTFESSVENHKHSFIYCYYCGSQGVHKGCVIGDIFSCEECSTTRHENPTNDSQPTIQRNDPPARLENSRGSSCKSELIDISESDDDTIYSYTETTIERTTSVTRQTFRYPLRSCRIQLARVDKSLSSDSQSGNSSVMTFDLSRESEMMESTEQTDSDTSDIKPAIIQQTKMKIISESDDGKDSSSDTSSVTIDAKENSDFIDLNENSAKISSSNLDSDRGNKKKTEIILNESSSGTETSDEIFKPVQKTGRRSSKSSSSKQSLNASSSDEIEITKPVRRRGTKRLSTTSSNGTTDNDIKPLYHSSANEEKIKIKTEQNLSQDSNSSPMNKRKRRTIVEYFREITSSDDEVVEVKPSKRKIARKSRSHSIPERPTNQRSISEMFKQQLNRTI